MSETFAAPAPAVRFMLDAEPEPGLLPRVLQPFAKRGLLPSRMWSHAAANTVHVEVELEAPPATVALIEGNLRQIVGVQRVFLLAREAREVA